MSNKRYSVDGLEFDAITPDDAIEQIIAVAADRAAPAKVVIKPYVEFLERSNRDVSLLRLLAQADWCLADGIAIIWAAHYLYDGPQTFGRWLSTIIKIIARPQEIEQPLPGRVAGISFTLPLLKQAAAANLRVYLVGSPKANTIEQTVTVLKDRYRRLQIVGSMHGTMTTSYEQALASDLQAKKPDLILVGLGFPLQEKLMISLRGQLPHGVLIGEGGSFDYVEFGGKSRRAPIWLRRIGLEWLWRLILEPGRLKRQLAIPRFMWRIRQAKPQHT